VVNRSATMASMVAASDKGQTGGSSQHFEESANALISAVLHHVAMGDEPTFSEVRRLLSVPKDQFLEEVMPALLAHEDLIILDRCETTGSCKALPSLIFGTTNSSVGSPRSGLRVKQPEEHLAHTGQVCLLKPSAV
jgi:hypothetical protein